MSRSFLETPIDELVSKLKVDEKIALLGAPNWWNTNAIPRLKIPALKMSDGPNGVRGASHFLSTPAQCLPCETSMASTFDTELIHDVGVFLAEEAKLKASVILLAPTCNIQRTPLGGRAFESFSEDPHLSGTLTAAYINGLQSRGVASAIKHFVANDQESERTAAESVMSDRALREIYLYPFMLAQKLSEPWSFMTAYGRLHGVHCSENPELLDGILRKEWGFDGIIMSDWYVAFRHGVYGTDQSINAGLDLEMPGPPRWRTAFLIQHCLSSQKLKMPTLDERAHKMLTFIQKMARIHPDIVFGDGTERSRDSPEMRKFCRKLAGDGMVLLKNTGNFLPITPTKVKKIAVIGPNAKGNVISGGGSAALKPTYVVTPWDGLVQNAPKGVDIKYELGCYAHKYLPTLESYLKTPKGESGWVCAFFKHDAQGNPTEQVAEYVLQDTRIKLNDFLPAGLTPTWTIKLKGLLTMDKTAAYELGLTVAGRAKLWIDGKLTIDNWTNQRPGDFFYGQGTVEEKATVNLKAGSPVELLVEYTNTVGASSEDDGVDKGNSQPALMRGVRIGGAEKIDPDKAINDAIALAAKSDVVVFVGGLTPEWESEGFDRPTLDMPGRQNELIAKLGQANPNTVVCIQAGSAVAMPWVQHVNGIVQAWYSGNEVGNALADILYGDVNPSGKLSLTLPACMEDMPSYLNLQSENGQIHYREDLFVGYKHYQARNIKPLFPFGFGLSYTKFLLSNLSISAVTSHDESFSVAVNATIANVGSVTGSGVVQLYITLPDIGLTTPSLQLKGFAKARDLAAGTSQTVKISLDKYAISYWNTPKKAWYANAGEYHVLVGTSSDDLPLKGSFKLKQTFSWSGL
ncbi:glycoside hydrolase family 3 protein [Serpula lacrymans var. lacrymans S7.3]|uniref:beta-glucosidase n=2 Tax=Serpula lacrymans var. lacrymans TaxID=341189 RepID=F8QI53_SERL3|nr:glycoside hydrolase family 3 protein [Serpula lacrymans var. lacrymans S7.9]EGN92018.1 glycoside hydrolase family 3 protein [Serpula lacrymans var. lacrymans S7.3]EGO21647.1 glycoside hydrolase family 3 protein [Serpula lacrymans var. lacrymans S7.9]